jgi:hypothetical protein
MDEDLAKRLDELLSKKDKAIADASGAATEAMKKLKEAAAAASQGAIGAAGGLATAAINATSAVGKFAFNVGDLLASFNSITSSTYGLDKAFTSVIPTLDNYMKSMSKVLETVGSLGSGVSAFGFSMGKATEGLSKIAIVGLDIVSNIIKFQLETSQKVADTYTELAKTGATFGGSINSMAMAAAAAGIPIQNFSKLITTNVESLSTLSQGVAGSAITISKMGQTLANGNPKLLAMYGNYDNLNDAITQYAALQAQVGIDALKDQKALAAGAKNYLAQEKELALLTGKKSEALLAEEKKRRQEAAYAQALSKMQGDMAANANYMVERMKQIGGPEAEQYMKEVISHQGKEIFSQTAILFEGSFGGPLADMAKEMYGNIRQQGDVFRQTTDNLVTAQRGSLKEFATNADSEFFAQMQMSKYGNLATNMQSNVAGAILNALEPIENAAKIRAGIIDNANNDLGAASAGYVAALNMAKDQQIKLDGMVLTNMTTMSGLVEFLYTTQSKFIENQELLTEAFNSMAKGSLKDFGAVLEKVVTVMGKRFFGDLLTPVQPGTEVLPNVPYRPDVTPANPDTNPLTPGSPFRWNEIFRSFKGWLENPTVTVPTPVPVSIVNQPQTTASASPGQGGPLIPVPQIATLGMLLDQQTVEQHTALLTNMERNTADTNIALGRLLNAMS